MSKLSDYSKFDHLVDSDEDEEQSQKQPQLQPPQHSQSSAQPQLPTTAGNLENNSKKSTRFVRHPQHEARFILKHQDRSIYEWEQTLNEVTMFIATPPIQAASDILCEILARRLRVGLRRNAGQFFLNEATGGLVDVESSTWTWDKSANLLTIELQKANKGIVWESVCCGGEGGTPPVSLDPMQLEQERQRLMLERWQEENPGMDFRGATFNGSVPDPRTYMGGVRYE